MATMDAREQRGLEIAALTKIEEKSSGLWLVPSQSGKGKYTVCTRDNEPWCNCPDYECRQLPCKHVFAVQYTMRRETTTQVETIHPDGTTVRETVTFTETAKVTYTQNWPAYNR